VDRHRALVLAGTFELDIDDRRVHFEADAQLPQPGLGRQDHRVILVVDGPQDALQLVEAGQQMDEADRVAAHFGETAPALEGEGRRPQLPEHGVEECRLEPLVDALAVEQRFRGHVEAQQVDDVVPAEAVGSHIDLLAGPQQARMGAADDPLVEGEHLLGDRGRGIVERRDSRKQVPGAGIVRLVHAPAADQVAGAGRARAIHRTAADGILLVDDDVAAVEVGMADQVDGRSQAGDAATDDMGLVLAAMMRCVRHGGFPEKVRRPVLARAAASRASLRLQARPARCQGLNARRERSMFKLPGSDAIVIKTGTAPESADLKD
jgi:hypothetical protein